MVNIQRHFGKGIRGKSDIILKIAVYENVKSGLQNMPKVECIYICVLNQSLELQALILGFQSESKSGSDSKGI